MLKRRQEAFPRLLDATIEDLRYGLEIELFTSVELTKVWPLHGYPRPSNAKQTYIARIREVNDQLHAVSEINPDALRIAAELDAQRAKGVVRGALHGIPVLLKDNIATGDNMNNTCMS